MFVNTYSDQHYNLVVNVCQHIHIMGIHDMKICPHLCDECQLDPSVCRTQSVYTALFHVHVVFYVPFL